LAAPIDGGGFRRIFVQVLLPMSTPIIVVAAFMQATGVWNDYILGLMFAGRDKLPMTVALPGQRQSALIGFSPFAVSTPKRYGISM
jgi:ABC-type glycerol-3-phosphate transport system permease component